MINCNTIASVYLCKILTYYLVYIRYLLYNKLYEILDAVVVVTYCIGKNNINKLVYVIFKYITNLL